MDNSTFKTLSTQDLQDMIDDPDRGSLITAEHRKLLPSYVKELFDTHSGFEDIFLFNNPRFLTKGYIDRLPEFGEKEEDGEYWHGRLFWRFVGWNNSKKYTGEDLREIRKKNGVGGKRVEEKRQSLR